MKQSMLFVLGFLFLSTVASAQSMPGMNHTAPAVIRGSEHPEAISDALAYHLVMIHIANTISHEGGLTGSSQPLVDEIGLSQKDQAAFVEEIAAYKKRHDAAIVDVAKTKAAYGVNRDFAVKDTRTKLESRLSPEGVKALDAYVQSAKSRMAISQ